MPHAHHAPGLDELLDQLHVAGLRVTTARRAVLRELLAAGDAHLGVDELASRVAQAHPAIHLSTVYRTLDALTAAGILTEARVADHPVTFHLAGDTHHHAVCSTCGATLRLPGDVLEPVRRALLERHGFHAQPQHLTIAGQCSRCHETTRN